MSRGSGDQWENVKSSSPYYRDKNSPLNHHSYRRRKGKPQLSNLRCQRTEFRAGRAAGNFKKF